jgi:hypothetical protein
VQVTDVNKVAGATAKTLVANLNDALVKVGPISISVDAGPNGKNGTWSGGGHPQDFYYYAGGLYYNDKVCFITNFSALINLVTPLTSLNDLLTPLNNLLTVLRGGE